MEEELAKLNDAFRASGVDVYLTRGVRDGVNDYTKLMRRVESFNEFNESNDPFYEHDFGSLTFEAKKIFWKIEYYDQELKYFYDPYDVQCRRVLTIMLAEEY